MTEKEFKLIDKVWKAEEGTPNKVLEDWISVKNVKEFVDKLKEDFNIRKHQYVGESFPVEAINVFIDNRTGFEEEKEDE